MGASAAQGDAQGGPLGGPQGEQLGTGEGHGGPASVEFKDVKFAYEVAAGAHEATQTQGTEAPLVRGEGAVLLLLPLSLLLHLLLLCLLLSLLLLHLLLSLLLLHLLLRCGGLSLLRKAEEDSTRSASRRPQ